MKVKPLLKDASPVAGMLRACLESIRTGDMVTRTGNDFTSDCLRQLCQADKTYSHCGIAIREHDTVFVYHALGGDFNPDQQLLREPLAVFVSPEANLGFGLFRFALDDARKERLLAAVSSAFRRPITFDMQFDLATDDKMYCSEFSGKMYRAAFSNDTMFTISTIGDLRFLAPDNLFLHPQCHLVYKAVYVN